MSTPLERLDTIRKRKEELLRKERFLTHQITTEARKLDTRRKIIAGGAVLAHAEIDPVFAAALKDALNKALTRDRDRALLSDLLPVTDEKRQYHNF